MKSRRSFLKTSLGASAGLVLLPGLFTGCQTRRYSPNKKIQVAQIGCGRMGRADMTNVLNEPLARVVAVCDLDSHRLAEGKKLAEEFYTERGESGVNVKTFHDYHDLLASQEIDAVIVTVPDHSHAIVAIEAALAGKHVYVEKPVTYSIAEAIGLRQVVEATKIILQTGSQQRSERPWGSFRKASEFVRNGRLGQLRTIKIGIGVDKPSGQNPAPMAVPQNLDYDRWLGAAPEQPYMEGRVHPQNDLLGRPGWITTEDFGLGMITNWGAHHVDIAHWAMAQELGGPLTVEARANFPADDLQTVHSDYHVELHYPGDVQIILDNRIDNGLRFEGDDGWIFCTRSGESEGALPPLRASDKKFLEPLGANAVRWQPSKSHFGNWLESIAANCQPIAPIQQSVRSLEACCAAWISMKLGRKLQWDVITEKFVGDAAANALRGRKARKPEFDYEVALKSARLI
jgi:predicted dehydrogenase